VAARGIDVQGIPYVVNFTLPDEKGQALRRQLQYRDSHQKIICIALGVLGEQIVWAWQSRWFQRYPRKSGVLAVCV
jgi:hypothetical protein